MLDTILVYLDGTEAAEQVLPAVVALAEHLGSSLALA